MSPIFRAASPITLIYKHNQLKSIYMAVIGSYRQSYKIRSYLPERSYITLFFGAFRYYGGGQIEIENDKRLFLGDRIVKPCLLLSVRFFQYALTGLEQKKDRLNDKKQPVFSFRTAVQKQ